jgi:hypothetical protein
VLRICRPVGQIGWDYRDERDYAAVVVFTGLHWGADFLEWSEGVAGVVGQMKTQSISMHSPTRYFERRASSIVGAQAGVPVLPGGRHE